jgi:prephenate dehydratase
VAAGDGSLAAVVSRAAARLNGLEILEPSIQQNAGNATAFWAIARPADAPAPSAAGRLVIRLDVAAGSPAFSILVSRLHEAGFMVRFVNSVPLAGDIFGYRYLLYLASPRPVRADQIARALAPAAPADARILELGAF